ncbi:hypothetical protein K438DRAFT_945376 [Mycena galopus ATCC 62051]|nr:hypothetical protein K438DRAFT_945376 [Mycena galopus ATCC 62051]
MRTVISRPDFQHDGEEDIETLVAPAFSCHYKGTIHLHTHAKIDHLLFNLGPRILDPYFPMQKFNTEHSSRTQHCVELHSLGLQCKRR